MAQRGAHRNAGHKARQAAMYAAALDDRARLAAAYGWFRSSAVLLARRRTPRGVPQSVHEDQAVRLVREMTAYLKQAAEAIDRGDYDARRVAHSEHHG